MNQIESFFSGADSKVRIAIWRDIQGIIWTQREGCEPARSLASSVEEAQRWERDFNPAARIEIFN
jgi:hypothetical protein